MKLTHYGLVFAAMVLTLVCLIVPALQWASVPTQPATKAIAALAALALGVCKIGFFPLAEWHRTQKRYLPAGVLGVAGVIFMALSVQSTSLFLQSTLSDRVKTDNKVKERETAIDTKIHYFNVLIENDLKNGYRTRALKNLSELERLESDKMKLNKSSVNSDTTLIKTPYQFSTLSLILHLACIFSFLSVTQCRYIETKNAQMQKSEPEKIAYSDKGEGLSDEQLELARRIEGGEFTKTPKIKRLIEDKAIRGGHKKVKPVFEYLESTGVLIKNGVTYEMT